MSATTPPGHPRPDILLGPDEAETLLLAATRAPSLYNSQPWGFAVGPRHVELYTEASRQLHSADPTGRSLLVSCGAALFNLRVAAEHLGFDPRVRVLPDDADPTLVAVAELGHRRPHPGGLAGYYPAIADRRTNRRPFTAQTIPSSALTSLREAASAEGAELAVYDDPEEVTRIIGLLHHADLAEHTDPARTTERQAWVGRPNRSDGIPVSALGPQPTGSRAAFRDLGHAAGVGRRDHAAFESAPTIAVLLTAHDGPVDWVQAGQALERLLLDATLSGVSASFLNQPLEQEDLRWLVRSPMTGIGHSQMILRLGYGEQVPATPRRPLTEVTRDPPVALTALG